MSSCRFIVCLFFAYSFTAWFFSCVCLFFFILNCLLAGIIRAMQFAPTRVQNADSPPPFSSSTYLIPSRHLIKSHQELTLVSDQRRDGKCTPLDQLTHFPRSLLRCSISFFIIFYLFSCLFVPGLKECDYGSVAGIICNSTRSFRMSLKWGKCEARRREGGQEWGEDEGKGRVRWRKDEGRMRER